MHTIGPAFKTMEAFRKFADLPFEEVDAVLALLSEHNLLDTSEASSDDDTHSALTKTPLLSKRSLPPPPRSLRRPRNLPPPPLLLVVPLAARLNCLCLFVFLESVIWVFGVSARRGALLFLDCNICTISLSFPLLSSICNSRIIVYDMLLLLSS